MFECYTIYSRSTYARTTEFEQALPAWICQEKRKAGGMAWRFCDAHWENAVISPAEFLIKHLREQEVPEGTISRSWIPECIHREGNFRLSDAGEILSGIY